MKDVKIKFIKEIEILSSKFHITWDKTHNGASFTNRAINIGIKSYKEDPLYTLSVISHELMEIILVRMGARFSNTRTEDNYLFNYDHQTFENSIQIHIELLLKFIKS